MTRPSITSFVLSAACLLLFLVVPACDPGGGEDVAAEQSTLALDSSSSSALLAEAVFSPGANLDAIEVGQARERTLTRVAILLKALFGDKECAQVETNGEHDIFIKVEDCQSNMEAEKFSIELTADVDFETTSCLILGSPATCPTAVKYDITLVDLTTPAAALAGKWTLTIPVADSERTVATNSWSLSYGNDANLTYDAGADWLRPSPFCIEDLSWDAELTINAQAQESIGTDIDTIVARASGFSRCAGQCPTSGTLDLAFGRGDILQITYPGGPTARAIGPNGVEFEVALPCE